MSQWCQLHANLQVVKEQRQNMCRLMSGSQPSALHSLQDGERGAADSSARQCSGSDETKVGRVNVGA